MTISRWSRDVLAERFGIAAERFAILPLAPDPFFTPGLEASPLDRPFVLGGGGGDERKNLRGFLEIFAAAFPQREVALVVAGNPDRRDRRRLARLGAEVRAADDEALRTLYRTACVVAVPSLAEGYGLVVAEAQACGAAVIASDASALPEAAGEAAALVSPSDREGWIAMLRALAGDEAHNTRLRAAGAARWAFASRDVAALAFLRELTALVHDRT